MVFSRVFLRVTNRGRSARGKHKEVFFDEAQLPCEIAELDVCKVLSTALDLVLALIPNETARLHYTHRLCKGVTVQLDKIGTTHVLCRLAIAVVRVEDRPARVVYEWRIEHQMVDAFVRVRQVAKTVGSIGTSCNVRL
jgi:hypothetical protein